MKNINDLPTEISLLIYENLSLSALINVIKSNPMHWDVVSRVVKNKIRIKTVNFDIDRFCGVHDQIQFVAEINFLMDIFKYFGYLIEYVKIDYSYPNVTRIEQLHKVINEYGIVE